MRPTYSGLARLRTICALIKRGVVQPRLTISVIALLLTLMWVPTPQTQTGQIKFKLLRSEHGLSQATVRCIFQDSQGFMWFGTQDGLNKFDGYSFTVYRHDEEDAN